MDELGEINLTDRGSPTPKKRKPLDTITFENSYRSALVANHASKTGIVRGGRKRFRKETCRSHAQTEAIDKLRDIRYHQVRNSVPKTWSMVRELFLAVPHWLS
jgi:hypothetical protein